MRTKNAIVNLLAALILSFITTLSGLILPKLFILTYGSEINGLISSIRQFLAYLNLVEAGVGYASMAMLYLPIKLNDYAGINSILSASRIYYNKSGMKFILLVLALSIIYPFFILDQISWFSAFFMVLILGVSGVSEFFLIGKYRVFLTAAQKGYVISFTQAGAVFVNILVSFILMSLKVSPIALQFFTSILYVLRFLLIKMYIEKKYKQIKYYSEPNFDALSKKDDVLIHQIVNLVLSNTPTIIITIFLGLKEVSIFSIYFLVYNMVIMLLSVFTNGFQAIFGDIISESRKDLLASNFHLFEFLFFMITAITFVPVAILYMPFIELYTYGISDANYIRPQLAILFTFIGMLHNSRIPSMIIVNTAGLFKETKSTAITEAILSLVISLIAVRYFGLEGVLFGWVLAYLYRIVVLTLQISKGYVYGSVAPTVKVITLNLIFGVFAYVLCKNIILFNFNSYFEFFINGVLCVFVSMIVITFLNFLVYKKEILIIKDKLVKVILLRTVN